VSLGQNSTGAWALGLPMRAPQSKPKTRNEGERQLATSLARLAEAGPERSVPLTELGEAKCRFIIDDGTVPALCCGCPTPRGSSWCEHHKRSSTHQLVSTGFTAAYAHGDRVCKRLRAGRESGHAEPVTVGALNGRRVVVRTSQDACYIFAAAPNALSSGAPKPGAAGSNRRTVARPLEPSRYGTA
jgi:hypothetical protein